MYARDSAKLPTFAVEQDARILGFLSLQEHFSVSWEVHCIAIAAEARNKGYGTLLWSHAESWLIERGVKFLQSRQSRKLVRATSMRNPGSFMQHAATCL